jgi:cytochrome c oxidase cbb3-type subunit 2
MSTGLSGTPMPSFSDSLPEADRWALSYYVLSLSAFTDPLTGEKMQISEKDRAALDDPTLAASESHYAYDPWPADQPMLYAGETWATKHGFDFAAARGSTADIKQGPH